MAALLTQSSAPIEYGDGAGMNLLDLESLAWSEELLAATAPDLAEKLRAPVRVGDGGRLDRAVLRRKVRVHERDAGRRVHRRQSVEPRRHGRDRARAPPSSASARATRCSPPCASRRPIRAASVTSSETRRAASCASSATRTARSRAKPSRRRSGSTGRASSAPSSRERGPETRANLMLPFFVPEITPAPLEARGEALRHPRFRRLAAPAEAARAVVEAQALSMQRHSDWIGEKPEPDPGDRWRFEKSRHLAGARRRVPGRAPHALGRELVGARRRPARRERRRSATRSPSSRSAFPRPDSGAFRPSEPGFGTFLRHTPYPLRRKTLRARLTAAYLRGTGPRTHRQARHAALESFLDFSCREAMRRELTRVTGLIADW